MTPIRSHKPPTNKKLVQSTRQAPKPKPPNCRGPSLPEPKIEGQGEQTSPATQLPKRQSDSDGNDERQLKRAPLTRKNLAVFNKMATKKESSKALASDPQESTTESTTTTTTKSTSTTSSGFAIQAYKNGILNPLHFKPPTNLKDIRAQYTRSRGTASPPPSQSTSAMSTTSGKPLTKQLWFMRWAGGC